MPTANGTGHECVCTNTEKAGDGKYIMKSVDDFKELQDVVHCCTQVGEGWGSVVLKDVLRISRVEISIPFYHSTIMFQP